MVKHSQRLLTVQEVAARLGLKPSTIRKKILRREIAYVKCGRAVRVPVEIVEQLIAEGWRDSVALQGQGHGD